MGTLPPPLATLKFALLFLVGVAAHPSTIRAQGGGGLVAGWEELTDRFWAADDLREIVPATDSLRSRHRQRDSVAYFYARALPFIRDWYEYGFFAEATGYLSGLEAAANELGERADSVRAEVFFERGRLYLYAGQPDSILYCAERCLALAPAHPSLTARAHNLAGIAHEDLGQPARALRSYGRAYRASYRQRPVRERLLVRAANNLGRTYLKLGEPEPAYAPLEEAVRYLVAADGDPRFIALGQYALGSLYQDGGNPEAAARAFAAGSRTLVANGLQGLERYGDFNLARGLLAKENAAYDEAVTFYDRAEANYREQERPPLAKLAMVRRNKANVFFRQGNYGRALTQHREVLALNGARGDSLGMADDHANLGVVQAARKDWPAARAHYRSALHLRQRHSRDREDLANDFINLADAATALGEYPRARAYADSARLLEESLWEERHPQLAYTYLTLARIAEARGAGAEALDWAQRSLVANHRDFQPATPYDQPPPGGYLRYDRYFEALLLKAELLGRAADGAARAREAFRLAGRVLENVRLTLNRREDQITLARFNHRLAERAIAHASRRWQITADPEWAEEAFYFAERSKANVLLSAIADNEARRFAGIPDTLIRREDRLRADLGFYKRRLATQPDSAERRQLNEALFLATQEHQALRERYAADYPAYYELSQSADPPRLAAVQSVLGPDRVLQSYFTGADSLYVFTIAPDRFALTTAQRPGRLEREVTSLNRGIVRQLDRIYLPKAHRLYRALFPRDLAAAKELILVPDGPLLKVPFEALLTAPVASGDSVDYRKLPYLLRRHALTYAPSAALFYQSRNLAGSAPRPAAPAGPALLALAPGFREGGTPPGVSAALGAHTLLGPLPETEREVEALETVFRQEGHAVSVHRGSAATEQVFHQAPLATTRFIHLATHGFVNETHPDLSGLALHPGDKGAADGFLSVGEVYNLRLSADLVTLSACETGLGRVATGEGVLGFSRAFLYAGAHHLLVSLWQVQDRATADLMVSFYRRILTAPSPDFAAELRAAKLELLNRRASAHPYYWSAFVLIKG